MQGEQSLEISCVKIGSKKKRAMTSGSLYLTLWWKFQLDSEDAVLVTSIALINLDLSSLLDFLLSN
jgi:hypothetical protein